MHILHAMDEGRVEGLPLPHDRIIETVLAKLYFRGESVYKIYKHRESDIGDLTDPDFRRKYHEEDFFWNAILSPGIYLRLHSTHRGEDGTYHLEKDPAHDHMMVMRKVEGDRDLTSLLSSGNTPTTAQLRTYVRLLLERLQELTQARQGMLQEFFDQKMDHVASEVEGVLLWAGSIPEVFPPEEFAAAASALRTFISQHSHFRDHSRVLSVVIDTNPDNILFLDDEVAFLDVMPPKPAWRVHDPYFVVCRTSADLLAYGLREEAEVIHYEYGIIVELPDPKVRTLYELAAALIQVPYRNMLGQGVAVERYRGLIRDLVERLEAPTEETGILV